MTNRRLSLSSSSSSSSYVSETPIGYTERLTQACSDLDGLPDVLHPASRPSSPRADILIQRIGDAITDAINDAVADPTHPKWGHVARVVKLGCTSRGYKGAEPGVVVGDMTKLVVRDVPLTLPETEEEWWEYEKKWGHKFRPTGLVSKYWSDSLEPSRPQQVQEHTKKLQTVQAKVAAWQGLVTPIDGGAVQDVQSQNITETVNGKSMTGNTTSPPQTNLPMLTHVSANTNVVQAGSQSADGTAKEKSKTKPLEDNVSQGSLGFSVVKRTVAKSGKPEKSGGPQLRQRKSAVQRNPTPPNAPIASISVDKDPVPTTSPNDQVHEGGIAAISEMSFLPPSFPSQLKTSTPPVQERYKPPPIKPQMCSSPLSSPPPTQQFVRPPAPSDILLSSERKISKRARSKTPQDDAMDITPDMHPPKRARVGADLSSSAPPPPSTPPPAPSSPANASLGPSFPFRVSNTVGLANANVPPVPTTPNKPGPLPELKDLLASSRRTKPRPRPVSRKAKASNHPQDKGKRPETIPQRQVLPDLDEDRVPGSEPERAKTYFSSPASGSSDSPQSLRFRPRSPVSPMFSQNPAAFAPGFVSSQRPGSHGSGGGSVAVGGYGQMQGSGSRPLDRGSSGFFAMGYSSQFDVEGRVGRVDEILGQDVDFDGWLRDAREVEDEEMAQSQGPTIGS